MTSSRKRVGRKKNSWQDLERVSFHLILKMEMPFPQANLWLVGYKMSFVTSVCGFLIFLLLKNFLIWKSALKHCRQKDDGQACRGTSPLAECPYPSPPPQVTGTPSGKEGSTPPPLSGLRPPSLAPYHIYQSLEESLKKQRPTHTFLNLRDCGLSVLISKVDNLCTLKCGLQT